MKAQGARGVITVGMLATIRRLHFRDKLSVRAIAKRTGLSRNTVRTWLRQPAVTQPAYPKRVTASILDPWKEQLASWLRADSHRSKRERRTAQRLFELLRAEGYAGGYGRVAAYVKAWRLAGGGVARPVFVPLQFAPGEAFQFDWSVEYAEVAGQRRRLEVAHVKLAHSRAFLVVAYPTQSHEMLFDAHTRAFQAFGGVPRRGIYDNMKTAVDKVGRGRERTVNARFEALCGHYLFEAEFCNRAAGWEKGVVEKNVQDRRRRLWQGVLGRSWPSLAALNEYLAAECVATWAALAHPEQPERTVAAVLADERPALMPVAAAFDGYVEQPVRVSATALVTFQRSRYSVPVEHAHRIVSLRAYPEAIVIVADGAEVARHVRCFSRYQVCYDWQHYLPLVARKPGALRNGAPFAGMPAVFLELQRALRRHPGGDRVMAEVLATVPGHGVAAVEAAVHQALAAGRTSGEHVLHVIRRALAPAPTAEVVATGLMLREAPVADAARYDGLRDAEVRHVD
jgi:transposase